jgi:hypothetical protein
MARPERVDSFTLPAGSYTIVGNTTIADTGNTENTICWLGSSFASGIIDTSSASTALPSPEVESLHLVAPLTTTGTTISIFCQSNAVDAKAFNSHLVAIKVDSVSGS